MQLIKRCAPPSNPGLTSPSPAAWAGDILVMDKLNAHKDREALVLLKDSGVTVRFLPTYSPDLNPIIHTSRLSTSHPTNTNNNGAA